jgi:hypothetical protein
LFAPRAAKSVFVLQRVTASDLAAVISCGRREEEYPDRLEPKQDRMLGPWFEATRKYLFFCFVPAETCISQYHFAHKQCLVWSPKVFEQAGRYENVLVEIERSRRIICTECRKVSRFICSFSILIVTLSSSYFTILFICLFYN